MSTPEEIQQNIAGLGHLINGEIVRNEVSFGVVNPSTGKVEAEVPAATPELLERAITAAEAALPGWAATPEEERRAAIKRMGALTMEFLGPLNDLASIEKGNPMGAGEAFVIPGFADHMADHPIPVDVLDDSPERTVKVVRKPIGVVAAITPWNAPILISAEKIFSALLVGNTIVLKPSPFTPMAVLKLGELFKDVVPPGVLNIVAGGDDIGRAMVEHPKTRMVSFTGSVAAGRAIAEVAGRQMKNVLCELGGNDVAIVLPDVDLPAVAQEVFNSAFLMGGQVCAAIKRLYVHESIYDDMVAALADLATATKAAPAEQGGTLVPLVTKPQYERIKELVEDAVAHGAKAVAGGQAVTEYGGYFFEPTILTNVGPGVRVVDEEQFGPVLPVMAFSDVEDAIAAANDSEYGLCGSVWTTDIAAGERIAARLECGTAWVNHHADIDPAIPFGGVKNSGVGRSNGRPGLDAYAELQTQIAYRSTARAHA
ncbi:MAG TPA: aldehyde dehydrogenase family protein [Jatrophihabitans sp.]